MSRPFQNVERFRRPELFLVDLLRRSARGQLLDTRQNVQFLHRATVVAVDAVGGRLENPDGNGGLSVAVRATRGPVNPKNSVRARIISDAYDGFVADDGLRTFWPLFPSDHLSIPIKVGEHVYVVFEDRDYEHGIWIARMPGHEGVNFFRGERSFVRPTDVSLSVRFGLEPVDDGVARTDVVAGEAPPVGRLSTLFGLGG